MEQLIFFDCSLSFGRRKIIDNGSFYSKEDLLKYMDLYGIRKGIVYHSLARENEPLNGNKVLMEEIKSNPNLIPAWTVMPHHTGEFYEPEILRAKMKENDVKIVRMFPSDKDHRYSLSSWNCKELFDFLSDAKIPVIIPMTSISFDEVYRILSEFKGLRMILCEMNYRVDRDLYPLLKQLPNLYIETMGYKVHMGIEEICSRFGAQRLIFGSSMPAKSGASAVAMINYARIGIEDKKLIASGNITRLLKEVKI